MPYRYTEKTLPAFLRRLASTDPLAKTWTCPTCGEMAPREIAPGYYVRQTCGCVERARREQEQQTQRTALLHRAYRWVGREWADDALMAHTFASFQQKRQPAASAQAIAFAQHPRGALALYGSYGTGKTHLLAAIAQARCAAGHPCLFVSVVTLFEVIQQRIGRKEDYHGLLLQAMQTPLLVLDDVDKPKHSEFREATYYHLIEKRTLAGLPLALSSNLMPQDLHHVLGEAACSRLLMDLTSVCLTGTDYRLILSTQRMQERRSAQEHE